MIKWNIWKGKRLRRDFEKSRPVKSTKIMFGRVKSRAGKPLTISSPVVKSPQLPLQSAIETEKKIPRKKPPDHHFLIKMRTENPRRDV